MLGEYASDKGDLAWRRINIKYLIMLVRNYSPVLHCLTEAAHTKVLRNNIQPNYKHGYVNCIHTRISGHNQRVTIRIYSGMEASGLGNKQFNKS